MRALTHELIAKAKHNGLRVFISQADEYGLISSKDGKQLLSFGYDIHQIGMYIATCYKNKYGYNEGSGRVIASEINDLSKLDLKALMINHCKETTRTIPETLEEHLDTYAASYYKEI